MESSGVQQVFFNHIKSVLPHHLSIVDEVANLLNISNDSAYRRMRGDKPLAFEEVQKLCVHFNLSLDSIFHLNTDSYIFSGKLVNPSNFHFELYLKKMLADIEMIKSFEKAEFYFLNKDVPLFHHFQVPELAAFKFFFFMKTILSYPSLAPEKFSVEKIPESLKTIGKKIADTYCQVSSTEIWNIQGIDTTLQQIDFYRDSRSFEKKEDLIHIYDCMSDLITHVEKQATFGKKYPLFLNENWGGARYTLYNNEVFIGDNTILVDAGLFRIAFINHSVINYMSTRNTEFCDHIYHSIQNTMQRSLQISSTGEKERFRFFNQMRENINRRKKVAEMMEY
ncbi:MAG TPA: helix-turn-helix domain-containing protein [Chitinophagaceae bacterium]